MRTRRVNFKPWSNGSPLAENEQWLADNYDKTLHGPKGEQPDLAFADEEELMLRRLGAAVVMQWSALPTKLQRELFDNATAVGELSATAARRRMIARFLHKKNDSTGRADAVFSECTPQLLPRSRWR